MTTPEPLANTMHVVFNRAAQMGADFLRQTGRRMGTQGVTGPARMYISRTYAVLTAYTSLQTGWLAGVSLYP